MDYKTLSVKTFIEDMNGKEIMMKTVPSLTKYPLKLFYKKTGRCHPGFHQGRRGALSYLICNRSPAGRQGIVFCLHGLHNSYFCAETQKTGLTIRSTCGTK